MDLGVVGQDLRKGDDEFVEVAGRQDKILFLLLLLLTFLVTTTKADMTDNWSSIVSLDAKVNSASTHHGDKETCTRQKIKTKTQPNPPTQPNPHTHTANLLIQFAEAFPLLLRAPSTPSAMAGQHPDQRDNIFTAGFGHLR